MRFSILLCSIITYIMCGYSTLSTAQTSSPERLFQGLFSGGLNIAQIDGDGPAGYGYFGVFGSMGVMVQFRPKLSASIELAYSMRGSRQKRDPFDSPLTEFRARMDYIEIPLLVHIRDKDVLLASVGLVPAVLARNELRYQAYDPTTGQPAATEPPSCLAAEPSRFDLSAAAGVQFFLNSRATVGARYAYSIIGIREPCVGETRARSQFHNLITVRFLYIL
ncbi:MAG TPA: outer membrane beta-barrel protein [Saprospiraceae bacterium]|nr:outer membrane beta-barrel protein [Saprospiraceae bacterium]HMP14666.1 outer membrane beta-barrel protein [Saprospiraceae bacterium]